MIKETTGKITVLVARPVVGGTRISGNELTAPEFEKAPPPGVENGGIWGTIKFFGPKSVFLVCLCFASVFLGGSFSCDCSGCDQSCNEDKKAGYFVNGVVYDKNGRSVG